MKSLVPIILIVAAVGLFFFEVRPFYTDVQLLRAEGAEYDEALEMATELGTLRDQLERKLESFSETDLARLNHFLPQQLDTVRIILDIDGIGLRNGLKVENIKVTADGAAKADTERAQPRGTTASSAHQTVDIALDFKAPYSQGVAFIKDLENSLRLFDASKVDITLTDPKSNVYSFKMNLKAYWINR